MKLGHARPIDSVTAQSLLLLCLCLHSIVQLPPPLPPPPPPPPPPQLHSPTKAQISLTALSEVNTTIPAASATQQQQEQQLYEEIRDVDPSPPNIVAPESTPGTPAAPMHHVEYEDVKPAVGVESEGTYHFTLCSAYGLPLERGNN